MKLFEVMYPKRAKRKVKEGVHSPADFEQSVRDLLWSEYQADPFMPAQEESPDEMSDEDYLDFDDHVRDILKYAQQHRIKSAGQAIAQHDETVRRELMAQARRGRH